MSRWSRGMTRAGNLAGFWATTVLDRVAPFGPRGRPADFGIELDELHRMDGHWALTFARLGTIHMPPGRLRELGSKLDFWSYLGILRRSRRATGPDSVVVRKEAEPAPPGERSVRVHYHYYGPEPDARTLHYPYVMHPWLYAMGYDRRVPVLRRSPRRFRLFFSGATNESYAELFPFPMMSRRAILECLLDTFRGDACVVESRADLAQLGRTDRPIVVVLFRGEVIASGVHHYLTRTKYLRLLARSAFALCPPGVCMPHSHNLIEAMAVGTIPVTNYAPYCRPPLVDGATCLAFSTPDDLRGAVRRLLDAPPAAVEALRGAVARYYDDHLSPDGFARQLGPFLARTGSGGGDATLILNREAVSARLWEESRPPVAGGAS